MGTLYSLVNIPYGSIAPAMTQVPTERATLASWRVWGSNLTILMLSFIVAPQIKKFAGDPRACSAPCSSPPPSSSSLGMALYLWTVMNIKEQVQRDVAAPSIKESFGTLHAQQAAAVAVPGQPGVPHRPDRARRPGARTTRSTCSTTRPYIAWNAVAQVVGTFLVAAFIPKIVRLIGKRNGFIVLGLRGRRGRPDPGVPAAERRRLCPWSASSCWASAWAG